LNRGKESRPPVELRKLSDSGRGVVAIDDSAFMLGFSLRENRFAEVFGLVDMDIAEVRFVGSSVLVVGGAEHQEGHKVISQHASPPGH
jgi:hypothetical protein